MGESVFGKHTFPVLRKGPIMSRNATRTDLLSRDTAGAIRYFCFGNVGEFYKRFKNELGMSRSTFYRILQGEFATPENIKYVELLAVRLKVADKGGGSLYLVKSRLAAKHVELSKKVLSRLSPESISNLRKFLEEHRGVLLS